MHWARGIDELQRFSTPPYGCLYLPAETASLTYRIIRDLTPQQYNELLRRGWRRFGCEFFRPRLCAVCPVSESASAAGRFSIVSQSETQPASQCGD